MNRYPAGRGIMRGAGAFRMPRPPPPVRARPALACFRCLEATPRRYDAAQTHLVSACPWPPNPGMQAQSQLQPRKAGPNFKVILFPDNQPAEQPQQAMFSVSQQPQIAPVSMGYNPGYDVEQYYDEALYYDPQHYYQE